VAVGLTFRESVSVPPSAVKDVHPSWTYWPLKIKSMSCPETSVISKYTLRSNPKERKTRNVGVFIPSWRHTP